MTLRNTAKIPPNFQPADVKYRDFEGVVKELGTLHGDPLAWQIHPRFQEELPERLLRQHGIDPERCLASHIGPRWQRIG